MSEGDRDKLKTQTPSRGDFYLTRSMGCHVGMNSVVVSNVIN